MQRGSWKYFRGIPGIFLVAGMRARQCAPRDTKLKLIGRTRSAFERSSDGRVEVRFRHHALLVEANDSLLDRSARAWERRRLRMPCSWRQRLAPEPSEGTGNAHRALEGCAAIPVRTPAGRFRRSRIVASAPQSPVLRARYCRRVSRGSGSRTYIPGTSAPRRRAAASCRRRGAVVTRWIRRAREPARLMSSSVIRAMFDSSCWRSGCHRSCRAPSEARRLRRIARPARRATAPSPRARIRRALEPGVAGAALSRSATAAVARASSAYAPLCRTACPSTRPAPAGTRLRALPASRRSRTWIVRRTARRRSEPPRARDARTPVDACAISCPSRTRSVPASSRRSCRRSSSRAAS